MRGQDVLHVLFDIFQVSEILDVLKCSYILEAFEVGKVWFFLLDEFVKGGGSPDQIMPEYMNSDWFMQEALIWLRESGVAPNLGSYLCGTSSCRSS